MFTIEEILKATRGTLIKEGTALLTIVPPKEQLNREQSSRYWLPQRDLVKKKPVKTIRGVSIDSRTIQPQELFIAIKGERFDGHDYVDSAIEKQAALMIVSKKNFPSSKNSRQPPMILVADTTKALGDLAHFHRQRFSIPIIAVTGSNGKTTTKEMIAAVLSARYNVLKNVATENNHIGVPMTLLRLNRSHKIAVLEFGTNQFGDIRRLAEITNPTVGLFTNIGESHLEFLKTPSGVFKEKTEMIQYMKQPAALIINRDDPHLKKILNRKFKGKIFTYGVKIDLRHSKEHSDEESHRGEILRSAQNDGKTLLRNIPHFQASTIKIIANTQLEFQVKRRQKFRLNTLAAHNVTNALAAIACGRLFHLSFQEIQERIANFNFPKGRQAVHRSGRFVVIDDTYNSNPVSVRSALETLTSLNTKGKKIFVCADMLELGSQSKELHAAIGKSVGQSPVDAVFTIGPFARLISQTVKKENKNLTADHFDTIEGVHNRLKEYCQMGDVILVKGSRGMRMERTVEFLLRDC